MINAQTHISPTIRVLLIGASGLTGQQLVKQLSTMDVSIRALLRNPGGLPAASLEGIEIVKGDVLDESVLATAMTGVDVVISALGTPLILRHVDLLSKATALLVKTMQSTRVPRLICITGMGAGDSRGHGGFVYDRLILPTLLRNIYADKDRQEKIIRSSNLDWLIVRPAMLTNAPASKKYREITTFANESMTQISRGDVARFIAGELMQHRYKNVSVNITY